MTQRLRMLALGAALLLFAGCASARAGTPIPDGDEVAEYVSAKFAAALERLDEDIESDEPRKSVHESFMRIDDKKANNTITAIQVGSPPSRFFKNHSNRDSTDYRDYFLPAGSDVEYVLLGPEYSSLAQTPWVSLPYEDTGLGNCFWGGYATVCKMLASVSASMERGHAAKQAKSLADGSVELIAQVTLREFLDQRVVVLPEWALDRISDTMRDRPIDARILLGPNGQLRELEMTGLISADGHEVEINQHYRVQDPPTEHDLPEVPSPDEVTALTTQAQVDKFYDGMGAITSGDG